MSLKDLLLRPSSTIQASDIVGYLGVGRPVRGTWRRMPDSALEGYGAHFNHACDEEGGCICDTGPWQVGSGLTGTAPVEIGLLRWKH